MLGEITLGRESSLFCGSDRIGVRTAAMYTLIDTAKLNNVDPKTSSLMSWAGSQTRRKASFDELFPWNWRIVSVTRRLFSPTHSLGASSSATIPRQN